MAGAKTPRDRTAAPSSFPAPLPGPHRPYAPWPPSPRPEHRRHVPCPACALRRHPVPQHPGCEACPPSRRHRPPHRSAPGLAHFVFGQLPTFGRDVHAEVSRLHGSSSKDKPQVRSARVASRRKSLAQAQVSHCGAGAARSPGAALPATTDNADGSTSKRAGVRARSSPSAEIGSARRVVTEIVLPCSE